MYAAELPTLVFIIQGSSDMLAEQVALFDYASPFDKLDQTVWCTSQGTKHKLTSACRSFSTNLGNLDGSTRSFLDDHSCVVLHDLDNVCGEITVSLCLTGFWCWPFWYWPILRRSRRLRTQIWCVLQTQNKASTGALVQAMQCCYGVGDQDLADQYARIR